MVELNLKILAPHLQCIAQPSIVVHCSKKLKKKKQKTKKNSILLNFPLK